MSSSGEVALLGLVSSFLGSGGNDTQWSVDSVEENEHSVDSSSCDGSIRAQDSHVKVVIFSKDRPWQLQQLVRSMRLDEKRGSTIPETTISLQLLLHITEEYQAAYEAVITSIERTIASTTNISMTCHRENTKSLTSFQCLMENIVEVDAEEKPNHWMFITDDCILLVSLQTLLQTATYAFYSNTKVKCFLSRLHPGISWTQTRSLPSPPPRSCLRFLPGRTPHDRGAYVYPLERGELDWAYPWDLSGGIYKHDLVKKIIENLKSTDGLSHPNRMEIHGNQSMMPLVNKNFLATVPTRPVLLILAINRVQNVYRAPLACKDENRFNLSPEALLSFYDEKKMLNLARYRASYFNSSHVGDIYLLDNESERATDAAIFEMNQPALSVLIPVHTGPPEAAKHAIRSILLQPIEEYQDHDGRRNEYGTDEHLRLSPMQIVLVDDRCNDGSINTLMDTIKNVASEFSFLHVAIQDYRQGNEHTYGVWDSLQDGIMLAICIVSSPRPGVAAALNHGLTYCRSDLVARMDADDIAEPGRLISQTEALRFQPKLNVVGASVLLFRQDSVDSTRSQNSNATRMDTCSLPYASYVSTEHKSNMNVFPSLPPTDPGFASWCMLFSCSVAHPSVMYRKEVIMTAGGYDESCLYAEDYELWLRLTLRTCSSLTSIPNVGLWHRKHRYSSPRTSKQSEEALQASVETMKKLLACSQTDWNLSDSDLASAASVLRKPDSATSLNQANDAANLLVAIETAFIQYHGDALTVREIEIIQKDCNERVGELATMSVQRELVEPANVNDSVAWNIWCERCPGLALNRVALLWHSFPGN